jgi:hypothetical protein
MKCRRTVVSIICRVSCLWNAFCMNLAMFHVSNEEVPRTIGFGKGGLTDKILNGSDSRRIDNAVKHRSTPPTLQDVVMQALLHQLVRLILVDRRELIGRILWCSDGRLCLKTQQEGNSFVFSCNRVMTIAPIEADEEAFPFITDSIRANLLACEERTSRLQIVRRRIRERNNRLAAAVKYSNSL